jgi:hypothetical protein
MTQKHVFERSSHHIEMTIIWTNKLCIDVIFDDQYMPLQIHGDIPLDIVL